MSEENDTDDGPGAEIRRTMQNLLPGSSFAVRVRGFNELGQYSKWSEGLEFTAEDTGLADLDPLDTPNAPEVYSQVNGLLVDMAYQGDVPVALYMLESSRGDGQFTELYKGAEPIYVEPVFPGAKRWYRYRVVDIHGRVSLHSPVNSNEAISGKYKKSSTLMIAAFDSTAETKRAADFVCDGFYDEIQIIEAIQVLVDDDAPHFKGGNIVLSEGHFQVSGHVPIYIHHPHLHISGQGMKSTYISVFDLERPGSEVSMFKATDHFRMSDLTIWAQALLADDDYPFTHDDALVQCKEGAVFTNVSFRGDIGKFGLDSYKETDVQNCEIRLPIHFEGKRHAVSDCNVYGWGKLEIQNGQDAIYDNNQIRDFVHRAFYIRDSQNVRVTNNDIRRGLSTGIHQVDNIYVLGGSRRTTIANNTIRGIINFEGAKGTRRYGIFLDGNGVSESLVYGNDLRGAGFVKDIQDTGFGTQYGSGNLLSKGWSNSSS